MNALGRSLIAILASLGTATMTHAESVTAPAPCMAQATAILAALDAGDFEQARAAFDARMQAGLSAEQLRGVWESLPAQVGKRLTTATGRIQPAGALTTAIIPLQYEKAWLELQVSCSSDGSVAGLFVRPGSAPEAPAPAGAVNAWTEREIKVETAGISLPGTLTLPKSEPIAAVVLVHGSGPNDRDETLGPNKIFRDLARGLSEHGVAVLRYDKRSYVAPASFAGKVFTVDDEVVDDAVSALRLAAAQPELKDRPIYLAGHSLGAMLAPRIAARQSVAGVILLAAPARPLTAMIQQQSQYLSELDGSLSDDEKAALEQLRTLSAKIDALTDADRDDQTLLLGAPAAYWLDLRAYDAIAQARALGIPVLQLQGQSDYQVTMDDDFKVWEQKLQGVDGYTRRTFEGLSHQFMAASDPPSPADYQRAGHIDARVVAAITEWIQSFVGTAPGA